MRKTIISVISILCFMAISINISAQSKGARKIVKQEKEDFQKFANDYKAMGEKTSHGGVSGSYEKKYNLKKGFCAAEDYKIPKKVGTLSFYIEDKAYSVTSSDAYHITTTKYKASAEKVNLVAQRIFEQSISALKESYALLGMELLTPTEFLTTEEQKNLYYNAPLNNIDGKADAFKLLGSGSAVPEGFRFLPYATYMIYTGKKFAIEKDTYISTLLKNTDLDAFIVVAISLSAAEGTLNGVISSFIFKNPGYENSGKVGVYAVGYTPYTASFVSMKFDKPMGGIFIKEIKEYTNKKGNADTKFVITDVDSNLTNLVNFVVERSGQGAVSTIPIKDEKKKKKKKK